MKKKLILEFEQGINPKYKKWTKDAAQKFVSFFPELQDNFEISFNGSSFLSKAEVEDIISRSTSPSVTPEDVWNMFEKQSDGSYLRKNSVDWCINNASTNGQVNLRQWLTLKGDGRTSVPLDEPLRISVAARNTNFAYGISDPAFGPCLSAAACAALNASSEEAYFKDIVMHELGHAFNATHEKRDNTVDNLGSHCTDGDCLMYEYAYTQNSFNRRQKIDEENPFCDDCMESMRDFMVNTLKMTNSQKREQEQTLDSVDIRSLPFFKNATPSLLATLDNYERVLQENNIQRAPKDKLLDMMSVYTSAESGQRQSPDLRGSIIGEDKFLLGVAKTDWNETSPLNILQSKLYSRRRYVTYTPPFDFDNDADKAAIDAIDKAQMEQGNLARVKDEGYWIRKYGQGYFDNKRKDPNKEVHRFILNVNPTPELFKQLDDFAVKFGCQYKFPKLMSWNQRIDPVVIYTSDERLKEQAQELIKIATPNVRTEMLTNGLDGTRLADGIFMAKERDKKDILALAKLADKNIPQIATKLREEAKSQHSHPLSLGEFLAFEELITNINKGALANYKYHLPEIDLETPSIRSLRVIYAKLKEHNPALADELQKLTEDFEKKHGKLNYTSFLINPKYQKIKQKFDILSTESKEFEDKNNLKVNNNRLDDSNNKDKSFKKGFREVFKPAAIKEGSEYVENIHSNNYQAQIKHSNGSIDNVEASSATNISLSSTNKEGKEQIPGMERFHNLAEYAHKNDMNVSFGDISSPEFKARLMIACLEFKHPLAMKGAPELNQEFLANLEENTRKQLLKATQKGSAKRQPTKAVLAKDGR